jgi:hypothetical protein
VNKHQDQSKSTITWHGNKDAAPKSCKQSEKQKKSAFLSYKWQYYISKQHQIMQRGHLIGVTFE